MCSCLVLDVLMLTIVDIREYLAQTYVNKSIFTTSPGNINIDIGFANDEKQ